MLRRFCLLIAAAMMTGCAALPPAQPAHDLTNIVGKWEGFVLDARRQPFYPSTLTIRPDGTFENHVPSLGSQERFVGTVGVIDEQFRWKNATDGRTGVFTLHEGGGKRVLISDGGGTVGSAQWEPAK